MPSRRAALVALAAAFTAVPATTAHAATGALVGGASRGTSSAPPATTAGPVASTNAGIVWDPSPNQVCWTVSARFADGSSETKSGCTTTSDIAGAGAG